MRENPFRDEIYEYLLNSGYQQSRRADYDYKNAIDTAKLLEFLEASQPEQLKRFKYTYGASYAERLIKLLTDKINASGLLAALNEQVEDYSSGAKFSLAYFKPNLEAMSEGSGLYNKNVFSVCREFSYENKPDSFRVDLAIFLNGIPLIMIELKKQTAGQRASFEGTKQFKQTRNPAELVFGFNKRTLVYFALDEFEAFISTRLDKKETKFLPFNQGSTDEGAGNPTVEGKHCTYYVWEEMLQKDILLKIIREFMFIDEDGCMIFPRYHQWKAVLMMENDVRSGGIGGRYLIWHSAGSGKTKTIAWVSKRLINIPEIDTVIVISDRNVIDSQLGNEITALDGRKGVVKWIETHSDDLLTVLKAGRYIVVTTLQKFPFILDQLKSQVNRKFAIIIDEAHSSTAGKTMSKVSETLSGKSLKDSIMVDEAYEELEDGQSILIKQEVKIKSTTNVSYFAFTATPKTETMELFGTRYEAGKKYFHKYSMKQAIEEEFILNPLACYTTYNEKFEVKKKKEDDSEYESNKTAAAILHHITSSDEVIRTKTNIIMDDFMFKRIKWLGGQAKAMIIAPSRKHAVCYKLAVERYIERHGCDVRAAVGFTGTIEIDGEKYTEENMNAGFPEKNDLRMLIKNNDDVRIIIVADKLQTGFDAPKLCILYVDKKLNSAVKAVQTLSRINRPYKNKKTMILDFVNNASEIKAYFEQYYGGELYLPTENETDPNVLFAKRDKILKSGIVESTQAEQVYSLIQDGEKHSAELTAILSHIKEKFKQLDEKEQKQFVAEIGKFVKLFYYISIVYSKWDIEMKRWAVFLDVLHNVLYEKDNTDKIDPKDLVELVQYSAEKATENENLLPQATEYELPKLSTEAGVREKNFALLDEIIERINARYGSTEERNAEIMGIVDRLSADKDMINTVNASTPSAYEAEALNRIEGVIVDGILSPEEDRSKFYAQLSSDKELSKMLMQAVIYKIQAGAPLETHY